MRSQDEVCREIAEMSTQELAELHGRIGRLKVSEERKASIRHFVFLLGLIRLHEREVQ